VVLVATIRALKMHGGGPEVKPGVKLDDAYTKENLGLLEKGCENLIAHIEIVKKSGIRPVVCINSFHTDTKAEFALIKRIAEQNGAVAVISEHWLKGGEGAVELAEAVVESSKKPQNFKFLYDLGMPLRKRINLIAKELYGAEDVSYSDIAVEKIKKIESDPETSKLGTCMVKTHLSLSHDASLKGRPRHWTLPVHDILVYRGAGFVAPVAGDIKLMPGTASKPAYMNIDVDVNTGRVKGLF
jgi:formate--tetrahydrofolate ligase